MFDINLGLSILTVISFIIVYFVLTHFFWRPILRNIKNREQMISNEIKNTKNERIEAERLRNEQEELLMNARRDAERLIDEARRSAERLRADVIQTAKMETGMILDDARNMAKIEKNKVIANIKQDITNLALLATEKIIGRIITTEEDKEIIAKTLHSILK